MPRLSHLWAFIILLADTRAAPPSAFDGLDFIDCKFPPLSFDRAESLLKNKKAAKQSVSSFSSKAGKNCVYGSTLVFLQFVMWPAIDRVCAVIKYNVTKETVRHTVAGMLNYAVASNVIELPSTCCIVIKNNDPIWGWMGRSVMWYKFCQRCSRPLSASKAWFMAVSHLVIADRGVWSLAHGLRHSVLVCFHVEAEMLMILRLVEIGKWQYFLGSGKHARK